MFGSFEGKQTVVAGAVSTWAGVLEDILTDAGIDYSNLILEFWVGKRSNVPTIYMVMTESDVCFIYKLKRPWHGICGDYCGRIGGCFYFYYFKKQQTPHPCNMCSFLRKVFPTLLNERPSWMEVECKVTFQTDGLGPV